MNNIVGAFSDQVIFLSFLTFKLNKLLLYFTRGLSGNFNRS